jgi:tRNA (guanine37-N1)-methyltransferase
MKGKNSGNIGMAFEFDVITLFPQMFDAIQNYGITQRAFKEKIVALNLWNPRDFTEDVHKTVDDRPYGGGPGMVMMPEPLTKTLEAVKASKQLGVDDQHWVVHLSPAGKTIDHQKVVELSQRKRLILLASRYEGVDQRFIDQYVDEELSIGDYVLSGGELPAMVLMDAIVRQLPGALGHQDSAQEDSFVDGLLDCPHYTRPEIFQDRKVPEVLLSGHHQKIKAWRLKASLQKTRDVRPDLLAVRSLTKEEIRLLDSPDVE